METVIIHSYYDLLLLKNNKDVKNLVFDSNYDDAIEQKILSDSLKRLTFGFRYDKEIDNILPECLVSLTFGYFFNKEINILPNSLVYLYFGNCFNKKIKKNVLPNTLKYLSFGFYYNQIIDKDVLPDSLIKLEFGWCYDQILKPKVLPKFLKHLIFGFKYNKKIDSNILPESLVFLEFGVYYNQTFDHNVLPNSLTNLVFNNFDNYETNLIKIFQISNLKKITYNYGNGIDKILVNKKYFKVYNNIVLIINKNKVKKIENKNIYKNFTRVHSSKILNVNRLIKNKIST